MLAIAFSANGKDLLCAENGDPPRITLRLGKDRIPRLELVPETFAHASEPNGESNQDYIVLTGKFGLPHWHLLNGEQIVEITSGDQFTLKVPAQNNSAHLLFNAVSPSGEILREEVEISVQDNTPLDNSLTSRPRKRLFLSAGLAPTYLLYKESTVPDFTEMAMTLKASFNYLLFPPKWDLGINSYFTLLPLSKSSAETARFLGINFRFGYVLPFVNEPWRISLMGGAYYTTMFVTHNSFGFANLLGPQLFPTVRKTLKSGDSIAAYMKYSTVNGGSFLMSPSNREIAGGTSYTHLLENHYSIAATLDISSLAVKIQNVQISTFSTTLGVAIGF